MNVGTPRVSVLMTVYNAEAFLQESIGSVLAQSFLDWEMVIVDDGSTDTSALILASYDDPRIKVVSLVKNIGRTAALRYGFDQTHGEYIAVLDADDVAYPGRLARQVDFLDTHADVVLVGSWVEHIDKSGKLISLWAPPVAPQKLVDHLGWHNPIVHSSVMYRRKMAADVGGYPMERGYAEDFALVLLLAQKGNIAVIDEYLCKLRMSAGSMTFCGKYRLSIAREDVFLARYAGKVLPLSDEGRLLNRRMIAKYEFRYGRALFYHGRIFAGIRMMVWGLLCFIVLLCMEKLDTKGKGVS
jgi:glycosyltransferase involved in cell wall biosynthesis